MDFNQFVLPKGTLTGTSTDNVMSQMYYNNIDVDYSAWLWGWLDYYQTCCPLSRNMIEQCSEAIMMDCFNA